MKWMGIIFALFVTISVTSACKHKNINNKSTHAIYLVRHAEKLDDGTKDPMLSEEGLERAEKLANMLENKEIHKIYATNFQRTKRTANPLANRLKLEIITYDPSDLTIAEELQAELVNGSILVVGHSNSTPLLVNELISENKYSDIDENDYGNIYVLTNVKNRWSAKLNRY